MDKGGLSILEALKKQMSWLSSNQKVIAQNVANADTPGYKAQELKKQEFEGLLRAVGAEGGENGFGPKTVKRPASVGASTGGGEPKMQKVEDAEVSPTGNSVVLEEEMLKLADNQMQYGLAVNLYRKHASILKMALGRGGR